MFKPEGIGTVVDVGLEAELGGVADLLGPLARVGLERGVRDNLAVLKRTLESPATG
jgi:predicted translin family RNA/ssDNA-binding protein